MSVTDARRDGGPDESGAGEEAMTRDAAEQRAYSG